MHKIKVLEKKTQLLENETGVPYTVHNQTLEDFPYKGKLAVVEVVPHGLFISFKHELIENLHWHTVEVIRHFWWEYEASPSEADGYVEYIGDKGEHIFYFTMPKNQ